MKNYEQARLHLEEALKVYESLHLPANAANAHAELAHVAWQEANVDSASTHCNAALAVLADGREKGRMLLLRGRILEQQADLSAALDALTEGLKLLDTSNDADATEACFALGNLLLRLGRAEEASVYLARAAADYRGKTR
jgi:tetratricopeptide (TPR) repeat protein